MITTIKEFKIFEKKQKNDGTDLLIVDVQESFNKFIGEDYLEALIEYCEDFKRVFQIWDNSDSHKVDYTFPNQVKAYEKSYGGELLEDDIEYYFHESMWAIIKDKFKNLSFESGDLFETINGDYFVYIDHVAPGHIGHEWFICDKELVSLFKQFKEQNRKIILVGGAGSIDNNHASGGECIYDIYVTLNAFNVDVEYNNEFVYSSKGNKFMTL